MTSSRTVWNVNADEFPAHGSPHQKLEFLLNYAVLAPSTHNSQPWLFRIVGKTVEVYADRTRALPVVDPEDRELVMSCGCALYHLRLAMHHFGYDDETEICPDEENPDLVAEVKLGGEYKPTPAEDALFEAISMRRTNRHRFEDRPVDETVLHDMQEAAEAEGALLKIIEGDGRLALADLIAEGDQRQMADKRFRRELAAWIHPSRNVSQDGMPAYAHTITDVPDAGSAFVIRTFELGDMQANLDYHIAMGSPVLAVLATHDDTPTDWMKVGQALARLLLRGQVEGVYASYLNQPVEVPTLRPQVQEMIGSAIPQLILRFGYGPDTKTTPRRPVSTVML
ncbi:MAG: nitroreductase [Anaerolineae bacterium]